MNLSIIIVNWNTRDLLAQCLASVYAHPSEGEFEVIVVDNASTDGSAQMVRERFPQVRLIENTKNVGFARANNQAIRESAGRYVLLLNPDTEVQPGALKTLARFMEAHPQAGAAGARLLNEDGSVQWYPFTLPTLANELVALLLPFYSHRHRWAQRPISEPYEVERIKGACLMVRRAVVDQAGLMDEAFFLYAEEDDWCYRFRRQGWRIFYVPHAEVVHRGGASTTQATEESLVQLYHSKVLFFRKHEGIGAAWSLKLTIVLTYLGRWIWSWLVGLFRPAWRERRMAYGHLLLVAMTF